MSQHRKLSSKNIQGQELFAPGPYRAQQMLTGEWRLERFTWANALA
jgi:hypothetical protein